MPLFLKAFLGSYSISW